MYEELKNVNSKAVEDLLREMSEVPTLVSLGTFYLLSLLSHLQNAFSVILGRLGFDFHKMLAPDELHEWLLGVWKAIFEYLIRLLYAIGEANVHTMDARCVLHVKSCTIPN